MGLPRQTRRKYISHKKKWDKKIIVDEAVLVRDYAIRNKKEIRRIEYQLSKLKHIAKTLNINEETKNSAQAKAFVASLKAKGFLKSEATSLDEVLDIGIRDMLERRLSNIVYKLKLSRTPSQARQFIVHRHVSVAGKVITSPTYSVSLAEEAQISFKSTSSLFDENHPERKTPEVVSSVSAPASVAEEVSADEVEAKLDDEEAPEVKE